MSLLIYSPRCKHSMEIVEYVNNQAQLKQLVQFHNVNTQGIPRNFQNRLTRVPTMLTKKDIEHGGFGGVCSMSSLHGNEKDANMFYLDSYGQSLQPAMTKELEEKISRDVSKGMAYTDLKM